MALIGYMRVSKDDGTQSLDLQRDALLAAGVAPDAIYEDLASGKRDDRPGLAACLKAARAGDVLVIWRLDRLGRNLAHLVNTVNDLNVRGVGIKTLTGSDVDTTSAHGRLVFSIFASLAQFERELICERTKAGLASARARGRVGGRKPKMNKARLQLAAAAMADRSTDVGALAKELGISRQTLYRHIAPGGELRSAK